MPADPDGGNWVVVVKPDPVTGLTVGVARPVGEGLREIRRTAVRNLAFGLGLVGLALFGIVPLSGRMTRHLRSLTEGAERLAGGDLDVKVPVPRGAEFGRLAETFNRMARDLRRHQERRILEERLHKELEISRRIQEELLPREPLVFPFAEVSGVSIPAREVGGDFFNYFALDGDERPCSWATSRARASPPPFSWPTYRPPFAPGCPWSGTSRAWPTAWTGSWRARRPAPPT